MKYLDTIFSIALVIILGVAVYGSTIEDQPKIYTDEGTGVQYIGVNGGLQVRIDAYGFPIVQEEGD